MDDKQRITNPNYRKFLDKGEIETIGREELKRALANVKGKHTKEGRSLLILLYFSGARPNEALRVKSEDIERDNSYVTVQLPGSKGGLARKIYLSYTDEFVKELYQYSKGLFPGQYCFFHFQNHYKRTTLSKKGEIKEYDSIADKLRYHFKKWFAGVVPDGIPPYFLRHNRFSKMSEEGASPEEMRLIKGSRTFESISPYVHLSSKAAKSAARKIK